MQCFANALAPFILDLLLPLPFAANFRYRHARSESKTRRPCRSQCCTQVAGQEIAGEGMANKTVTKVPVPKSTPPKSKKCEPEKKNLRTLTFQALSSSCLPGRSCFLPGRGSSKSFTQTPFVKASSSSSCLNVSANADSSSISCSALTHPLQCARRWSR